ncbi:hypothetical protein CRYUN_Cryun05aG0228800 [Craigia yunnanensis]
MIKRSVFISWWKGIYDFLGVRELCYRRCFRQPFGLMMEEISKLPLPEAFLNFLEANGIDPSIYTASDSTPPYLRLKPGSEAEHEEIEAEIKCKLEKVNWLPGFYSLPPDIQIANSKAYQDGTIYGIDAASGAAVSVLKISPGDHILDLCAAPGAKLCMMLDLLGDSGSVTGVDVARYRLAAFRTMLQKYSLGDSAVEEKYDKFREWTSKKPWKERKKAAKAREAKSSHLVAVSENPELIFYGRHSGIVGLSKIELYKTVSDLEVLSYGYNKLKLLRNGFRMLKVGGLLVYSTCSLTVAQNEDIVEHFLKENASAENCLFIAVHFILLDLSWCLFCCYWYQTLHMRWIDLYYNCRKESSWRCLAFQTQLFFRIHL